MFDDEVEVPQEYDMRDTFSNHFTGLTNSHSEAQLLAFIGSAFLQCGTKFLKHPQNKVKFILHLYKECKLVSAWLLFLPSLRSKESLL